MAPPRQVLLQLRDWSLVRRTPTGEVPVLREIDLDLGAGRWLAVLGANGSGKSSLLKFLASDESPLTDSRAIMFQDPDEQIVTGTVERELTLGRPHLYWPTLLEEYQLGDLAGLDPRLLSAGQKQRLVLAVSLGSEPEVLFCDEPTSLQDDTQAAWVLDRLDQWREKTGGTLVTATCDRREAARADDLLVLKDGRVIRHGPRNELWDDPLVAELLGAEKSMVGPVLSGRSSWSGRSGPGSGTGQHAPILTLQRLGCRFHGGVAGFFDVDLQVQPGQRIGITGPNGCGKSTLLAACVGARKPDRGSVALNGRPLYHRLSRDLDHGLAMLAPQFPEYLFTRSTVAEEIALDPELKAWDLPQVLGAAGLPADIGERNPHSLSSGQKRRLALALVMLSGRPLLLLDEPTAALDCQGRDLAVKMVRLAPPGAALVIASHDRDFLRRAGCQCLELGPGGLV
jgi:energy-coupling factor transporter ATP-binding protein EcfA2